MTHPRVVPCVWGWEGAVAQEEPVFRGQLGQSILAPPTQPAALVSLVSALMWARGALPGHPNCPKRASGFLLLRNTHRLQSPQHLLPVLAVREGTSPR